MQLKALALNDMGRCEEAIVVLDRIIAVQSDNAFALAARGHALLGMSKFEESLPYFDKALAIDLMLKEAQVFKGMALYFLGKFDEAMAIPAFKTEFVSRFKDEIDKKGPAGPDQGGK
jgi:tetratricopeptide (TPR) repeat protein